ncbi:MAG TPA: hypothetical protein DIV86_03510 [Alphaproteobacteria bacterium]|nr:hypothetical protein [Alphaproteobacteria bacterium]
MKKLTSKYLLFISIFLATFSVLAQEETLPLPPAELKSSEFPSNNKIEELSKEITGAALEQKKAQENRVIENIAEEVFTEKKAEVIEEKAISKDVPAKESYSITVSPEKSDEPKNQLAQPEKTEKENEKKPDTDNASDNKSISEQKTITAPQIIEPSLPVEEQKKTDVTENNVTDNKKTEVLKEDQKQEINPTPSQKAAVENKAENISAEITEKSKDEVMATKTTTPDKAPEISDNRKEIKEASTPQPTDKIEEVVLEEKSNLVEKLTSAKKNKVQKTSDEIIPQNIGKYTKLSLPESMKKNHVKNSDISIDQVVYNNSEPSLEVQEAYVDISILNNIQSIPPDDFNLLENIAYETNKSRGYKISNDININRGSFNDPFSEEVEDESPADNTSKAPDTTITTPKKDIKTNNDFYIRNKGLKVEVKKQEENASSYYINAQEALQAGYYESAITYYKKILETRKNDKKVKFGLATAYHKAGQLDNAKDEYLSILNMDANNSKAMNNYLVLITQENQESAILKLEELTKKNPYIAAIPAQVGTLYYNKGDMEKAAQYFLIAVQREVKNTNYRYNLAVILEKMQQNKMAAKIYRSLLDDAAKGITIPENPSTLRDRYFTLISNL